MIKVLLVDDEELIKNGLKSEIDWKSLECTVVSSCANGEEARAFIMKDPPDIVISDIRMPIKDGLTLMQEVKPHHPKISFIFISGHDEFNYVQTALKLGALDYILKPIDMFYLQEQLKAITEGLKTQNKADEAGKTSRLAQTRQFLQQIIFNSAMDEVELQKDIKELELPLKNRYFQVMSLQIDKYYHHAGNQDEGIIEKIRSSFYQLINLFDRESCYSLTESFNEFDLCLTASSEEGLNLYLHRGIKEIAEKMEAEPFTVSIGIGEPTTHVNRILKSFTQAREALGLKFIKGDNRYYYHKDVEKYRREDQNANSNISLKQLLIAVSSGSTEEIPQLIDELGESIIQEKDPQTILPWIASDLLLQTKRLLEEREIYIEEVIENPQQEWRRMSEFSTAEGYLNRLKELLLSVASYVNIRKNQHSSQILDQSIRFIKQHFTEGELSLERTAAEACMSPSYFAVVFKQETGQTFNRYLTKMRIDKAKDLILYTDMKSYEIGPKVGYDNPSYFSTVFKKATGHSPSDYRRNFS